jgi:hypothetical protein
MAFTMTQRTFKVELFQGDDLDRISELRTAAESAKPGEEATPLDQGEYASAAEAHDAYLADAKTRAVTVEMKPLLRKDYQALLVAYPPRDDDPGDSVVGANANAMAEPLLLKSITSVEVDGTLHSLSDGERQEFLDSLNAAQFAHLMDQALTINRVVFAPKAPLLGSAHSPSSGETSGSPGPSD